MCNGHWTHIFYTLSDWTYWWSSHAWKCLSGGKLFSLKSNFIIRIEHWTKLSFDTLTYNQRRTIELFGFWIKPKTIERFLINEAFCIFIFVYEEKTIAPNIFTEEFEKRCHKTMAKYSVLNLIPKAQFNNNEISNHVSVKHKPPEYCIY